MLFERRAYRILRPGAALDFWKMQRKWNTPRTVPRYFERCVGYFETVAGGANEIVHYYRYNSYDDWRSRLYGMYTPERAEYFASARALFTSQNNMFLIRPPCRTLLPCGAEGGIGYPANLPMRFSGR